MPGFILPAAGMWWIGMPLVVFSIFMLIHDRQLGIATIAILSGAALISYGAYSGAEMYIGIGLLVFAPSCEFARRRHAVVSEEQRLGKRS